MTKEEILQIAKPILFNTDMTVAILENRKGVTRRVAKHIIPFDDNGEYFNIFRKGEWTGPVPKALAVEMKAHYHKGDYLYVREAWSERSYGYIYKANGEKIDNLGNVIKWHPSIHMPKEAARIFLKVTDVRVERLQDITEQEAELEGCSSGCIEITGGPWGIEDDPDVWTAKDEFIEIWDSTIPKKDLDKYGWEANPWVWVYEFEREEVQG